MNTEGLNLLTIPFSRARCDECRLCRTHTRTLLVIVFASASVQVMSVGHVWENGCHIATNVSQSEKAKRTRAYALSAWSKDIHDRQPL